MTLNRANIYHPTTERDKLICEVEYKLNQELHNSGRSIWLNYANNGGFFTLMLTVFERNNYRMHFGRINKITQDDVNNFVLKNLN